MAQPLTLVSAPTGYGKTTLVAAWLHQHERPFAWLSLDEHDNDPARFLIHLIAALQKVNDAIGQTTQAILASPQQTAVATLLTPLINDLANNPFPFTIVLDDCHLLHAAQVYDYLAFLLDHQPAQMHLLLSTRSDPPLPLPRLRAQGQINEIRREDLRFSPAESGDFLQRVMGLSLDMTAVKQLEQCTEGWIVGLQLAALSLQKREDSADFINTFAGDHHYLADYLAAEILQRMPANWQNFLLQTAVLDQFCSSLVAAVVDELPDQLNSQAVLEELDRANLFLVQLDDRRHWYRYHHLFADFLRTRLLRQVEPSQSAALHQRASLWYEQQQSLPGAIRHALAGKDYKRATRLIEQVCQAAWLRGDFDRLRYWFTALPDDVIASHPYLCLFHAWVLSYDRRYEQSQAWLAYSARAAQQADMTDADFRAIAAVFTIILDFQHRPDPAQTAAKAREALRQLSAEQHHWRTIAYIALSYGAREVAQAATAERALYDAVAESRLANSDYLNLLSGHNLVNFQLANGRLQRAKKTCDQLLEQARYSRLRLDLSTIVHNYLGQIHLEWYQLAEANRHFTLAFQQGEKLGRAPAQRNALIGQLWLHKLLGQADEVMALFEKVAQIGPYPADQSAQLRLAAYRALVALTGNDQETVNHWVTAVGERYERATTTFGFHQRTEYLIWAHVQLAHGKQGAQKASEVLDRLRGNPRIKQQARLLIEVLTLLAGAQYLVGQPEKALETLDEALILAEPEGYRFTFLIVGQPMYALLALAETGSVAPAYVRKLRQAFQKNESLSQAVTPHGQSSTNGPLSRRELEVLRLVALGHSNRQIAAALHVSINTVKAHLKRINVKLGVHNRTTAVVKAQELHLI